MSCLFTVSAGSSASGTSPFTQPEYATKSAAVDDFARKSSWGCPQRHSQNSEIQFTPLPYNLEVRAEISEVAEGLLPAHSFSHYTRVIC